MSIYDRRDTPAYEHYRTDPQDAKNPFILSWWDREHDALLKTLISRHQWVWYWSATDEIVAITPPNVLEAWRRSDPSCRGRAWYNVLMYFAASRADEIDLARSIRQPQTRDCLMCKERFVEDSLPVALVTRLGVERLEFCAPCLRDTVLQGTGDPGVSRDAICTYLRDLAALIGSVPAQGFGEGLDDLHDLETNERVALLHLLRRKPTVGRVKEIFGSWLGALVQAEILEDGARRTSRGVQTIAKDGHVCLSLGEKTICDSFYAQRIAHEKEPRYPQSNYRGDFLVGNTIVEYFGLAGDAEYDAKIVEKTRLCKQHGIPLVAVYPRDLASRTLFVSKMSLILMSQRSTAQQPRAADVRPDGDRASVKE